MQVVLEDVVHDRVDEEVVGARLVLDVDVGAAGHPGLAGVADDEARAAAERLLHLEADDRMRVGRVRADQEQGLRVLDLADAVGHGAGAERQGEAGDGGRVAGGRALVHVVRAAGGARQLLREVVLLVRAAAGTEDRDAVRAVPLADFPHPLSDERERLVPRRLAERAVLADQRLGQALGRMDELEPEAPLHAQVAVVRHAARFAGDAHDAAAARVDVQVHLAARAAIRARGPDLDQLLGAAAALGGALVERGGRARADALAAQLAGALVERDVEGGADLHGQGAAAQRERLGHDHLGADLDAALAPDAFRRIVLDALVAGGVVRLARRRHDRGEARLGRLVFVGVILQQAIAVLVATGAGDAVLAEEEFERVLPRRADGVGLSADGHAGHRHARAGGVHAGLALDLDEAQPARAGRRQARIVAEMRDAESRWPRRPRGSSGPVARRASGRPRSA